MSDSPPRSVTVEGRSVQEAIGRGLGLLGVPRDCVNIRILSEENKGLFGMRGAKPTKVRLTIKPDRKRSEEVKPTE